MIFCERCAKQIEPGYITSGADIPVTCPHCHHVGLPNRDFHAAQIKQEMIKVGPLFSVVGNCPKCGSPIYGSTGFDIRDMQVTGSGINLGGNMTVTRSCTCLYFIYRDKNK